MPTKNRFKTRYPGVFYYETQTTDGRPDRVYYSRFRKKGKMIDDKEGFASQGMTAAKASRRRAQKIEGKIPTNAEKREMENFNKAKWTFKRLWEKYKSDHSENKDIKNDQNRFDNYINKRIGEKMPAEVTALDFQWIMGTAMKGKAQKTKRNVKELIERLANYGRDTYGVQDLKYRYKFKKPLNNERTDEFLTESQLKNILNAIEKDDHLIAGSLMLWVLHTGMRRKECFRLQWKDIDFERNIITIRDTKSSRDEKIPLTEGAKRVSSKIIRTESPYVFPGRGGRRRTDIKKAVNKIRDDAGLPKSFRALHGLRHAFASMLASSGEVDLYTLQKLLTHKSPRTTQRYAHLIDDALKRGSSVAEAIIEKASAKN